jgi:hypothetical protein
MKFENRRAAAAYALKPETPHWPRSKLRSPHFAFLNFPPGRLRSQSDELQHGGFEHEADVFEHPVIGLAFAGLEIRGAARETPQRLACSPLDQSSNALAARL